MRLIDGDALEERFQSLAYDDWNQGVTTSWADAYRECADMVYEQPAIESERKTGTWYEHYSHEGGERDGVRCSECGTHYYFGGQLMNYCPNCGADMREGTDI